ncbi:MAG: glycosyltransferase family 2 protein [Clostridia bacterium]|nr:glycosyltransferase family 2 protein [Clostridia bacterium]
MDVSVIIVNYHSAQMVIDCIRSIFEKNVKASYEIIVVDNASGDGSVELLREAFGSRIKVIASDVNLGFGKANNLGAQHAEGDYLFLLNPDTLLVNDAISVLVDYLKENPDVGVAGGNLYAPDMTPTPSLCRRFDDLGSERRNASWLRLIGGKAETKLRARFHIRTPMKEFNFTEKAEDVAYVFGADMMIPRHVFDEVGGFDPDFFMYAEEEEMTWRIAQKGYRVVSVPQAKIIHLEGATTNKAHGFSERQFRMRMNGTLTYYKKRFGDEGAAEFFRLRTRRYDRLMKIAKVQGKLTEDFAPAVMKRLLAEEYQAFTKK